MSEPSRVDATGTVVAIDGPSGVGKSTVARAVAQRLELAYLDTGAMYRAVAVAAQRQGVDPRDHDALESLLRNLDLQARPSGAGEVELLLDSELLDAKVLRTPEISQLASRIAVQSPVRRFLVERQRQYGERWGAVLEGRDIGTVVFPGTRHKFFLDARPEVRAERRLGDLRRAGRATTLAEVLADQAIRDRRDSEREDSPLTCDESYRRIDTSDRTPQEVIEEIVEAVRGGGTESPVGGDR